MTTRCSTLAGTRAHCPNPAEPNYSACASCIRTRLTDAFGPGQPPVARRGMDPEWVRRMRGNRGVPKDWTAVL